MAHIIIAVVMHARSTIFCFRSSSSLQGSRFIFFLLSTLGLGLNEIPACIDLWTTALSLVGACHVFVELPRVAKRAILTLRRLGCVVSRVQGRVVFQCLVFSLQPIEFRVIADDVALGL